MVPAIHILGSTDWPPRFELADGSCFLRGMVHADVARFADEFVAVRGDTLCSESRSTMPLLFDQTDVWDVLLQPRSSAATREVLLLRQKVGTEVI